jgi:Mannosyl-glycoprotein endo-beta-N-acetylglucosaminidase
VVPGGRTRQRFLAIVGTAAAVAALSAAPVKGASATTTAAGPLLAAPPALTPAVIRAEQDAIVTQSHQPVIDVADFAVAEYQITVSNDQQTLDSGEASAASAQAVASAAAARLRAAAAVEGVDADRDRAARNQVTDDRNRLGTIAVNLYTGGVVDPQFITVQNLATDQQVVIDETEIQLVAEQIDKDLHADIAVGDRADRVLRQAAAAVAADQVTLSANVQAASNAAAPVPPEVATLDRDQGQLVKYESALAADQAALHAQLVAVAGPASAASGVSVMGPAVLNAGQLSGWFNAQGYVDLTPATIAQLTAWYIQEGRAEGVRGDVAFAQGVLETGGFDSPDAVGLNNYAGIGHCDSCSAGWAFPSPQGGVLGQLQLLRIFAGGQGGPAGAPPPVLPALTPAKEGRSGCCQTWESLTGIWATDPTYGAQILTIYQGMLAFATSSGSGGSGSGGSGSGGSGSGGSGSAGSGSGG